MRQFLIQLRGPLRCAVAVAAVAASFGLQGTAGWRALGLGPGPGRGAR